MIVTHNVTIDLADLGSYPQIDAMQDDQYTRDLAISLLSGEEEWPIPEDASVVIRYCKSDGVGGEYDTLPDGTRAWSLSGNVLTLALAPQVLTVPGTVLLSATLIREAEVLSIFSVHIHVRHRVRGIFGESRTYYNVVGFLPGPANGQVGQYLRISQVDETGKVVEVEGANGTGGTPGATSSLEPGEGDLPRVYFTGTLPTSKSDGDLQLTMRYISKTADFQYPVTLKVQGSSSVNYPKKNFTLKPYKDDAYESKQKLAFKNWPAMNKFVLKAHWMDHSHVRNVGCAKIWGNIMKSRTDFASLPEELRSSPNLGATDGFTVKVYANGVYQGLYEWIVAKDKLFGQDSDNASHSILGSEWNNQPTCAFATTSPTINGNWSEELQDEMTSDTRTSMENWIKFVAGSSDEEFAADAETYFDVQSVIDADIFDRIFCTVDNLCRNQIVYKYADKWYVGKWDLDAVMGLPPLPGQSFFSYDTEYQTGYVAYRDYKITNMLYQRVENLFRDRFLARYNQLRAGVLSAGSMIEVFERLTDVIKTYDGLLEEDYAPTTGGGKFTAIPYVSQNNLQQIRNFLAQRTEYMDAVIGGMGENVPCTGITLSSSGLAFYGEDSQTLTATVTPDGCTDPVTWESSNTSVAMVEDGVVTAVANGTATITARCGSYSAACSVEVDGMSESAPCTGITLNQTKLTFTEEGTQTLTASVNPVECTDQLVWQSSDTGVVTVKDGVVTALRNGTAKITVVCGSYSATCEVSVSGITPYVRSFEESSWTNGYINDSGQYVQKDQNLGDMNMSDYIQIQPSSEVYTVSKVESTVHYLRISYYDSELNWIENKYSPQPGTLMVQAAPDNAACYVISCKANGNKNAVTVTTTEYAYPESNFLSGLTWTAGTIIMVNGNIANDSGVVYSSAFDISGLAGADIRLSADISLADGLRIGFWNEQGTYISGAYDDAAVHCLIPEAAVTAKIAMPDTATCRIMLGSQVIGEAAAQ